MAFEDDPINVRAIEHVKVLAIELGVNLENPVAMSLVRMGILAGSIATMDEIQKEKRVDGTV